MVSVCEPHPGTADNLFQTFIFTFITDTRYVNIYFELPKNGQRKMSKEKNRTFEHLNTCLVTTYWGHSGKFVLFKTLIQIQKCNSQLSSE